MGARLAVFLVTIVLLALGHRGVAMSMERPSVLLNAEEIARLRDELETVAWKKALYEQEVVGSVLNLGVGVKSDADRWLEREIEIPARSGHFHNFFCDDGNQLTLPKDGKPTPEGYACPVCRKVYKGERYDGGVRWRMHNELSRGAFNLALGYSIEGDERYAAKAAEILTKYADAYPGPHTSVTKGGIMYQSLCEAVWSIPLAWAYDLIYNSDALTPADRTKIEEKLFKPVATGLRNMGIGGNWGSWHLSAVGVIGFTIRDRELIEYAVESFKSQIANQLGEDGLWPESIHTYHFYPLRAFLCLAEAARHNGFDLYNWEAKPGKSLKSMFIAPLSYMYPDFRLPAINDGWFKAFLPLYQYELAYARYGDAKLGWVLSEGYSRRNLDRRGLWTFLHGRSLDGEFSTPELGSTNFPVLGIAVLRSENGSMLTFDYGPYLGHGQPDKMGITLFANDRLLVADYGTCGYGSAALRWYKSTPAHNTVVVDGKNQAGTKERRLTSFEGGPTFEVAEAETEEAYPGVLHRRAVLRVGDYFIVLDRLSSEEEHAYDWFLRCEGRLEVGTAGESKAVSPLGYEFVNEKAQYSSDGVWMARWQSDEQELSLFMLEDDPSLITAAQCPAETVTRKVPLLIARKSGKQACFTAVLAPYRGCPEIQCSASDGLVRVEHDGVVDWVYVGDSSKRAPLRTDGSFALVRTKRSEPTLACMVGGKTLVWKGRVLLRGSGGETWQQRAFD